jgi:hypothetical protein
VTTATQTPTVGDQASCSATGTPTVHACKRPCFWIAVGSKQPGPHDLNYLFVEGGADLYLNMVDADARFFRPELFTVALDFIDHWNGYVHIHCNEGKSRAPSIALLWLAKRAGEIPARSYSAAKLAYLAINPSYTPGAGISQFMADNWEALR